MEVAGHIRRVKKEVDPRYFSALMSQSETALLFENVKGYDMPVLMGLLSTRNRMAFALGTNDMGKKFADAIAKPIPPVEVKDGPCREVIIKGDDVDLTRLPIPFMHSKDGGPYISSGVVFSKDPEYGNNVGMYRLMYRNPKETSIDLVSPSDMRFYYERAYQQGKPLEIAVAIGCHPCVMTSASYKAPMNADEMIYAGGLQGAPVDMVKCETVDLMVPANAEIVLEGEILPIGWTEDEGRFGDFAHLQCEVKWNPVVRYKAITMRKDAMFYALQMPWENDWLAAPVTEAAGWRALLDASVQPVDILATPGSCCYWELVASIRKRPGEGKNALLALLSVAEVKIAIVTDDDIDIYNPEELDWAMCLRMQPTEDVIVIPGARGKHLDPSTKPWLLPKGGLPTSGKLGIDATIPEGVTRDSYERLQYAFKDHVQLKDYLG
jgi:2,5-furandicarboxylate decarboxylase 1